ncbi:MAG: hypothetical protein IT382_12235 [Deltaproteobacteria bacterium]|nr:hypothetical protein [Deltaproteobacteria bacterium]
MFSIGYKKKGTGGGLGTSGLRLVRPSRRLGVGSGAQASAGSAAAGGVQLGGLSFTVEPLGVPSVVRPTHEPHVLYVRLAAPAGSGEDGERRVTVLPQPAAEVRAALEAAAREGVSVERAVLVGADSILDPAAQRAPGHDAALGALVELIGALSAARLPFVWRTRGGIDGPAPHALAQALADAGRLAVVELGVPSMDAELCAALEGGPAVAPEHRLRLAAALEARGVTVRGLIDPLVPMLTDQQQNLEALVSAFAEAGVRKLGARYIVLTRERARAVASRLAGMQRALLQGVFADEPWQKPDPEGGQREVHKRIPAHLRRAGHHRLLEAAARHGLYVDILDALDEAESLTPGEAGTAPPVGVEGEPRRPAKKRRPQLELFRKAEKPS